MKRTNKNKIALLALLFLGSFISSFAQDSVKKTLVLNVGYFMNDNKMIYLKVNTKTKIDTKFQPVKNAVVNLYLDTEADSSFIARVTTNETGIAKAIFPPALKTAWDASPNHILLGVAEGNKEFDETKSETTVTKTKILLDTATDAETKSIVVSVLAQKGEEWLPAADVEMRVGISRFGGILSAGDEETYTTDSSGTVTVEIKKDSLPGDEKGNIVLVAKVEDNDEYGNLQIEKTAPWGKAVKPDTSFFDQRALWSTRYRTPPWLLFMAYSIVIGVWSAIIYLVVQIVRIKKLGDKEPV